MVSWSKSHLTCINKVIFWKKHWEPLKGKKAAAIDIMTQASSKIKKKKKKVTFAKCVPASSHRALSVEV